MLTIILMMACGILVGRLLRKKPLGWLSPLTTVLLLPPCTPTDSMAITFFCEL